MQYFKLPFAPGRKEADMAAMLLSVLLQGCCLGGNAILQKKAQLGRLHTLADSAIYTTLLAAVQSVLYLCLPPYGGFPAAPGFYLYTTAFSIGFFGQLALFLTAFRLGPASMTTTIRNLNMLVPITLGLFIWNEPLTVYKVVGLAIFIGALVLMNKAGYTVNGKPQKISSRWLTASIALLLVCGICGSISKQVMLLYPGTEKVYLLTYNLIVVALGTPVCLFRRKKTLELLRDKHFVALVFFAAAMLAASDFVYVTFVPKFDSAFFMPLTSTVSMIAVMIFSRIFLNEKIAGRSLAAAALCVVAVIVLSHT
jgi:drug/metabolite transporter (DMT)-like permease